MKKLIALILLVVVLATLLCACSTFTCDLCGKEVTGKKNTQEIFGEKIEYCNDCKDQLEDLLG